MPRHALLEEPALVVHGAEPRVERGPVRRRSARAPRRAEGRPDGPAAPRPRARRKAMTRDLVARVEVRLDLVDVLVDPVARARRAPGSGRASCGLADHRRGPGAAGSADRPGSPGPAASTSRGCPRARRADRPPRRRSAPARSRGRGVARLPLEAVEHGLAESPLDHGVDRGALLLDDGLDARCSAPPCCAGRPSRRAAAPPGAWAGASRSDRRARASPAPGCRSPCPGSGAGRPDEVPHPALGSAPPRSGSDRAGG